MTVRPILFSAPMIRALLAGRKTQTRRLAWGKGVFVGDRMAKPGEHVTYSNVGSTPIPLSHKPTIWQKVQPGDLLWVRETWAEVGSGDPALLVTRADYPKCVPKNYEHIPPAEEIKWRVSIHMERRHSRLTLEVSETRLQQLHEIVEADAIAEGIERIDRPHPFEPSVNPHFQVSNIFGGTGVHVYGQLWASLHGVDSWEENPDVAALTFTVHKQNIDTLLKERGAA